MSSTLYTKINYTQDVSLLSSCDIYEYDIKKANISVLYNRGQISFSQYEYLYNQPNMSRKVLVGLMERENPNITREKQLGIEEAKKYLFESNNIEDYEIISIKNDAIFVTRELTNTKYKNAEFTLRNHYNLFLRIFRLEIYYFWNPLTDEEKLDIKGIRDEVLEIQKDYMIDFFKEVLHTFLRYGAADTIVLLKKFYMEYINKTLDIRYYLDLATGEYKLNTPSIVYNYTSNVPDVNLLPIIDISNNAAILRELSKIFYIENFRRKK